MKKKFTSTQIEQADKLVGQKQKIYYPWKQKNIYRVVRKDHSGYYINYHRERLECIPWLNMLEDKVLGFMVLHEKRR